MKTKKPLVCGLLAVIFALAFIACETEPEPAHEHQWGEWRVTARATCIAAGEEVRVCKLDATHIDTQEIPINPDAHNWSKWEEGDDAELEPTCEDDGIGTILCTRCGTKNPDGGVIPALGHDWEDWDDDNVTKAPTCTEPGNGTRSCKRSGCDKTDTGPGNVPIDPEAHNWKNTYSITTPATCSATGIETDICTRDQSHTRTRDVAIDSDAHDYVWQQTTEPSFIEIGVETEVCSHNNTHTGTTRDGAPRQPITASADWTAAKTQLSEKANKGSYTLTIDGDFNISSSSSSNITFGATASGETLSVTLMGSGILSLSGQGNLIRLSAGQTLIIDGEDLTLKGRSNNYASLVYVAANAALELRNGKISDNTSAYISDDYSGSNGGGVFVAANGTFTMSGGEISGNTVNTAGSTSGTALNGGGVYVAANATFAMSGGKISGNTNARMFGGGVYVAANGTFIMSGGEISGNKATSSGGGVYVTTNGKFYIENGTVYGSNASPTELRNTGTNNSAAWYITSGTGQRGTFSDGTWTSKADLTNSNNTVKVENGEIVQ